MNLGQQLHITFKQGHMLSKFAMPLSNFFHNKPIALVIFCLVNLPLSNESQQDNSCYTLYPHTNLFIEIKQTKYNIYKFLNLSYKIK